MSDFNTLIEFTGKWGLGIVLSLIIIYMFKKFLDRVMDSVDKERISYKELINQQGNTINNHISHFSDNVHDLSDKVNEINANLGQQKECLDQGFTRVVEAIKSQTDILSNRNNGG